MALYCSLYTDEFKPLIPVGNKVLTYRQKNQRSSTDKVCKLDPQNKVGILDVQNKPLSNGLKCNSRYIAFLHNVTAAILVFQNKETAAILVYQAIPPGIKLYLYTKIVFRFSRSIWPSE